MCSRFTHSGRCVCLCCNNSLPFSVISSDPLPVLRVKGNLRGVVVSPESLHPLLFELRTQVRSIPTVAKDKNVKFAWTTSPDLKYVPRLQCPRCHCPRSHLFAPVQSPSLICSYCLESLDERKEFAHPEEVSGASAVSFFKFSPTSRLVRFLKCYTAALERVTENLIPAPATEELLF